MYSFPVGENRLSTAIGRWASVGPYYAMFPIPFAFEIVQEHCPKGGAVLDPFAGRGSSIYAAAVTGRVGYGIEINRVGWLYSKVKLAPAPVELVLKRLRTIGWNATEVQQSDIQDLPKFFHHCFAINVLQFLLYAQHELDWENSQVDATLMAIILVLLHGNRGRALSNQMRQSKAMAPAYSIAWWEKHNQEPPEIDPVEFLTRKIEWRYKKGIPTTTKSVLRLGDANQLLEEIELQQQDGEAPTFDLLFTSPPYYNVTSYHYDQWLRLWMLGGPTIPTKSGGQAQDGFWSQPAYRTLLRDIFTKCRAVLKDNAVVYVRTDARTFTKETTIEILSEVFPGYTQEVRTAPLSKRSQTALFGDKAKKPGEIDIILKRPA